MKLRFELFSDSDASRASRGSKAFQRLLGMAVVKRIAQTWWLPIAATLIAACPAYAQHESAIGVPVKVWATATYINWIGDDGELGIDGEKLETSPGAGDTSFSISNSGHLAAIKTGVATVRLEPGKAYQMSGYGSSISSATLTVAAPPGYTVEIDGIPRRTLYSVVPPVTGSAHYVFSHLYTVRILSPLADVAERAGETSPLAATGIGWRVSLGSLLNGNSAGSLAVINSGTASSWATLFTPASLNYVPPSSEIQVIPDSNNAIRQIVANQAVVDVVTNSSTQFDVKFYHPAQAVGSGTSLRTFTGLPYVTYRLEQGGTATTLQITSSTRNPTSYTDTTATVVRTAVTSMVRSGSAPNFTWTMHDWNVSGSSQLRDSVTTSSGSPGSRSESSERKAPSGSAVEQLTTSYTAYSWGEEPTVVVAGSSTGLQTTSSFFDNSSNPGSKGFLDTVIVPGGGWTAYDYWDASDTSNRTGTVKYRYRPFNNSPATPTRDVNQGEVTYYEYVTDAFNTLTRPSLVQTTVNGTLMSKSVVTYTSAAHSSSSSLYVVTATSTDYADATHSLATVTKYFREDAGVTTPAEAFYRSLPYSLTTPDGVKSSFAYQRGSFNESTHAFTASSGGSSSRVAILSGSSNSSAGTSCTTYDGFDIDDLYLVANKSTLQVAIRDSRALLRRTENYAWDGTGWNLVNFADCTYNIAGQLTEKTSGNGAIYGAEYNGELKVNETDETGAKLSFTYDDAGRVWTATKENGPTTTFTYDAANRSLTEVLSTSGTGETLTRSHTFDTAGRPLSDTPPGLLASSYSYDPANRQRTITAPDTGTTTETYLLDGRLASLTGSAVVSQYYSYAVESDGRGFTMISAGGSSSVRWQKRWNDWLGRPTESRLPGFSASSQSDLIEKQVYEDTTGHLLKIRRTNASDSNALAPTLYSYDALGNVVRSGLDVDNNGSLDLASSDRIIDNDSVFEFYSSAWWEKTTATGYPTAGSSTGVVMSLERLRLTGFSGNVRSETQSTDAEGNSGSSVVEINRGTKTVTRTVVGPGLSGARTTVAVNGLVTSITGFDGLVTARQYDGFERRWKTTDPRSNTTFATYKYGSPLIESVTDAAGNAVSTVGYDTQGRTILNTDATGRNTRYAYNYRGQVTNQWGDGAYPISIGYDSTYGDRTSLSTYRAAPTADAGSWPSVGTADTTTWTYDIASGLLWKKTDAASHVVQFDYNVRGQTASRLWARTLVSAGSTPVTASYGYDSSTGELTGVTYNDSGEAIPTPGVGYTYNRLGQPATVTDGTGTRTFNYNTGAPWRIDSEALPAFYGSRLISRLYDSASSASAGSFGSYTVGTVKGSMRGFDLGVSGDLTRDLHQTLTTSNAGRLVGVTSQVGSATAQDFIYSYKSGSRLLDGYTAGANFAVSRDYEDHRDLATRLETKWGATPLTRFDYAYNTLGQRATTRLSGSAMEDYYSGTGYSHVFNVHTYNGRGELQTTAMYRGDTATVTPSSGDELPGRRFEYRHDSIGNRATAGETGLPGSVDDEYSVNSLNQYTQKENNTIRVVGTSAATATVAVGDAASTNKLDRVWGASLLPANSGGPVSGTATVYGALAGAGTSGADLLSTTTKPYSVPAALQNLTYDADGNLANDGVWAYTYDAENQLVRMVSVLSAGAGVTRLKLDFKYDYAGRRAEKIVYDLDAGSPTTPTSDRRFIYDGNNLIAELNALSSLAILRSYTWGLDLAGSLGRTAGVGALLQIRDHAAGKTYWPGYDGNGNLTTLVNAGTGALAAVYEYDPFGNALRAEILDAAIADNPFRFSTKYTDLESGLAYYGLRYYSPGLGRFINQDPIGETGGLNLYGFCGNDAINRVDVLGLDANDPVLQLPTMVVTGFGGIGSLGGRFGFGTIGGRGNARPPASRPSAPNRPAGDDVLQLDPMQINATSSNPIGIGTTVLYPNGMYAEVVALLGHRTYEGRLLPVWGTKWIEKPKTVSPHTDVSITLSPIQPEKLSFDLKEMAANFVHLDVFKEGASLWTESERYLPGDRLLARTVVVAGLLVSVADLGLNFVGGGAAKAGVAAAEQAGKVVAKEIAQSAEKVVVKALQSETVQLEKHLQKAITRFETESFSVAQKRALIKNPRLKEAFRGDRIDTFFKESVLHDPSLQHLEITPRFKFGPDVFDPVTQRWWDVTTSGQWQTHVEKYWLFGDGTSLLTH